MTCEKILMIDSIPRILWGEGVKICQYQWTNPIFSTDDPTQLTKNTFKNLYSMRTNPTQAVSRPNGQLSSWYIHARQQ